jgi:hypothetical protein
VASIQKAKVSSALLVVLMIYNKFREKSVQYSLLSRSGNEVWEGIVNFPDASAHSEAVETQTFESKFPEIYGVG